MPERPRQTSLSETTGSSLLNLLCGFVGQLPAGSVALLRPMPSDFDLRRDDVDLLMSETTRADLLQLFAVNVGSTCERAESTRFHFRVTQTRREKIRLTIWDLNCDSSLQVDLWSEFRQFPNQRSIGIPAESLLAISPACALNATNALNIPLLRPDVHFCLLVLHLASKRKPLSATVTHERLTHAFSRLKAWAIDGTADLSPLLTLAECLLNATSVSNTTLSATEAYLSQQVTPSSPGVAERMERMLDTARGELRRWWIKRVPCIAIDGSDGAGKTTLIRSLCRSSSELLKPVVTKKLYRRSWIYQIVSSALRRLTGSDRCTVDDQLATFTTVRATLRLWCSFAWSLLRTLFTARMTLVLDRSIGSLLIRNRKGSSLSMTPMWSSISQIIPPMTTVLLQVPWSVLQTRKQEVSEASHLAYQSILWLQANRRHRFDLIVFDNDMPSDSAADCLLTMLGLATESRSVADVAEPQHVHSPQQVAA